MKFELHNRESRVAIRVGLLVAIAAGIVFALDVILTEGGGSLSRGWSASLGYLSFYGIFMLPILAVGGVVAIGLSRLIGGGIVMLVSTLLLGVFLIHGLISSTPQAQLERVTGRAGTPNVRFEEFSIGHSFSDGSAYRWIAKCSPAQAVELAHTLGLKSVPAKVKIDGPILFMEQHQVVRDYKGVFESGIEGVDFYTDDRGMIGGYSADESRFRLYWWPAAFRKHDNARSESGE